jgi:hypothetical protein
MAETASIASWLQQLAENHPSKPFSIEGTGICTEMKSTGEVARRVASLSFGMQNLQIKKGGSAWTHVPPSDPTKRGMHSVSQTLDLLLEFLNLGPIARR